MRQYGLSPRLSRSSYRSLSRGRDWQLSELTCRTEPSNCQSDHDPLPSGFECHDRLPIHLLFRL
jgi:hypothetical protein